MGALWPLQKAKNEFSRVVDLALSEGPQQVSARPLCRNGQKICDEVSRVESSRWMNLWSYVGRISQHARKKPGGQDYLPMA